MLPVRARALVPGVLALVLAWAPFAFAASEPHPRASKTKSTLTATATVKPAVASSSGLPVPKAPYTQWGLAAIGAPTAWALGGQGQGITVAIVDSGANLNQRDLAPNLWTDPTNGSHGVDLVAGGTTPTDQNGHGTHVAGIIGAACIQVCGVAPHAKLMIVRVLDASADGESSTVAQGIDYAVDHGAKIVNLSLAGPDPDPQLQSAIGYAQAAGVIIVVAAGNSAADVDTTPSYPASYESPNLLSVAATDINGRLGPESDWGPHSVNLAAPGQGVLSTSMTGGDEWRTGTSMAAPMVAGALADLWSMRPMLTWQQLEGLVESSAQRGLPVISGTLNLGAAATSLAGGPVKTTKSVVSAASSTRPSRTKKTTKRESGHAKR